MRVDGLIFLQEPPHWLHHQDQQNSLSSSRGFLRLQFHNGDETRRKNERAGMKRKNSKDLKHAQGHFWPLFV
ncbi:hypothetical protein FQA47_025354 [Oryzias melastigma]|uniref:Uncharacterized protein n=1 Tax=Oryzias melastigma TaxID=30732 RepID=A0A834F1K6_ORYME|nr:hypothetical protein FQA47_025354 [Oryzias melastigma]